MKALFRYPGSKWSIADWIIGHFPEGYEICKEYFDKQEQRFQDHIAQMSLFVD